MIPIIYYGNALLSGSLSGENDSSANPVARVRDGSVNLPYTHVLSGASRLDTVAVVLTSAVQPDSIAFPKCALTSGVRVQVWQASGIGAPDLNEVLDETLPSDTSFYLADLSATSGNLTWIVGISATAQQPLPQYVHEILLARKYTPPRSPEVSVTRTRLRQFTRLPIPGGQPFTKRDGPMLRNTLYSFVVLSGAEVDALRNFISEIDGGQSFVITDDLGSSYWAELIGSNVPEQDDAGVSSISLQFQEVKVE